MILWDSAQCAPVLRRNIRSRKELHSAGCTDGARPGTRQKFAAQAVALLGNAKRVVQRPGGASEPVEPLDTAGQPLQGDTSVD